jgi:sugar phosphate isomerase/epimerase
MKKSFVVSTQSTNFNAVALKSNLEENLRKLSNLGFDGVELAVRNPVEINVDRVKKVVDDNHLEIVAIGTGQAWGDEGLSFTEPEPDIRKKAVERIKLHIKTFADIKPQIIIGLIRGLNRTGLPENQVMDWMVECFQECADYASNYPGVILALEPINRYETSLINNISEALDFLKMVKRDNVKILIDTFHMNIEEPDIVESIKKASNNISHVHFADSNRWAPGWGHLDFTKIIEVLKEIGYDGYISAEIMAKPTPETCAEETMKLFKKIGL